MLRERGAHGAGHGVGQVARPGDVARGVAQFDREHAARAVDRFGVQQPGEAGKRARLIAVDVPPSCGDVEEYLVGGIDPPQIHWLHA